MLSLKGQLNCLFNWYDQVSGCSLGTVVAEILGVSEFSAALWVALLLLSYSVSLVAVGFTLGTGRCGIRELHISTTPGFSFQDYEPRWQHPKQGAQVRHRQIRDMSSDSDH